MVKFVKGFLALALVVLSANTASAQDRPRVIAVNKALHYFTERILGDEAEVIFPVPKGVDPSFWRPSISDISTIQSADLILLNGAGFATWIDRVSLPRSRVVNTSSAIEDQFIVTESITHSHGDGGEHSHEGLASYTWLDPKLAIEQVAAIASAAVSRGLAPEEVVEKRLAELTTELTELDAKAQDALSQIRGIEIIATHPRYQYFARRYGLSISSLEWEAGAKPSDDQLEELAGLAKQLDARILIWEAQPPQEAADAIEALGLADLVFDPMAGEGSYASFFEAYSSAISGLSEAASPSSN